MELKHYLLIFAIVFVVVFAQASMKVDNLQVLNENTSHYNETIDNAVDDSLNRLLEVQNDISHQVNLTNCSDAFFKSLFAGFGVADSATGQQQLQMYVPLLLLTDYDGFYIMYHSTNTAGNKTTRVWTQQLPYYTSGSLVPKSSGSLETAIDFQIRFTMTEQMYLTLSRGGNSYYFEGLYPTFLIENAGESGYSLLQKFWSTATMTKNQVKAAPDANKKFWGFLAEDTWSAYRQSAMIYEITKKMNYYVNEHNSIARQFGISYTFDLPESSMDSFARTISDVSLMAIFQGYPFGTGTSDVYSRYSVSGARLYKATRYPVIEESGRLTYHRSTCKKLDGVALVATYTSKEECAGLGAYPCPDCRP